VVSSDTAVVASASGASVVAGADDWFEQAERLPAAMITAAHKAIHFLAFIFCSPL
jgi:hypothetical protein